jgi:hypothetical protein
MEVHAHSHTSRKKWTHYLWEFLMLFLAVTLGFFVENQREHFVEHQREKQFVRSLFNDITADTVNLRKIIAARTRKELAFDSLSYLMNNDSSKYFTKLIYFYAISIARTLPYRFIPNDGTLQQLKNSGSLRLIRKRSVVDSISKYDMNVRNMLGQQSVEEGLINSYRDASTRMFDALVFDPMLDENVTVLGPPEGNPALQPYTRKELYEWNYRLYGIRALNKANRRDLRSLLQQANNLLNMLKEEYHLE